MPALEQTLMTAIHKNKILLVTAIILLSGCTGKPGANITESTELPIIYPDYSGIILPANIAPLNFLIENDGSSFYAELTSDGAQSVGIKSKDKLIRIPQTKWKELVSTDDFKDLNIDIFVKNEDGGWTKFRRITNRIAPEPVDPYLSYRLLYPGYESWTELSIRQRNLESFREWPIIENSVADDNCINCHSFNNGNTGDFLFHMRGTMGGTYFYSGGELKKTNLKTNEMKNGAVYPRWHPSGRFVAFSSNRIVQQFHSADNKKVEVSDLESSLVLFDLEKNEMIPVLFPDMEKYMDTYPEWSPDGKYIYFCRTEQIGENYDYRQIRYNLCRAAFDQENRSFGVPETIFDAAKDSKSISFPRISPDGRLLAMTIQDYGCFPIWHKETDIISLDLETMKTVKPGLNSDFTDSYHSWSSNGRWLVFSSKRGDGLTARPYLAYIDRDGNSGRAFILPQEDPGFYHRFLKSFNIPEFSNVKVNLNPGEIRKTAKARAIQAGWSGE
ncbi:MAG: PD40 domain-containing protein [Bacteroidales bacterium]|nr:PD40 domain-containing protein [Bacteroidales bacterium]